MAVVGAFHGARRELATDGHVSAAAADKFCVDGCRVSRVDAAYWMGGRQQVRVVDVQAAGPIGRP